MTLAARLRAMLAATGGASPALLPGDVAPDGTLYVTAVDTPAAVLVPIVDRPQPGVLLTVRDAAMRNHAGQIAFPGGRIDPTDADAVAAALREAEEEIGLPRDRVEIVGLGDLYRTVTGFEVMPVIGVVPPDLPLVPHVAEVADIFEVPLAFLLDTANQIEKTGEWQGQQRRYHEIAWRDRIIWGATAAMIVNLGRRLKPAA